MVRIKLGELLGKHRMRITDLAAATGIHRNTLQRLYHERNQKIDITVIERICEYFNCPITDLIEFDPEYKRQE